MNKSHNTGETIPERVDHQQDATYNSRNPNNYRAMVCAFITSVKHQRRVGQIVIRNQHCWL
jgi:hypothetical protein